MGWEGLEKSSSCHHLGRDGVRAPDCLKPEIMCFRVECAYHKAAKAVTVAKCNIT